MPETQVIEQIKLLLTQGTMPGDAVLSALLAQADAIIRGYLRLDHLPDDLLHPRVSLVLTLYNRLGAEGEQKRVEGEVASTFEEGGLPAAIRFMLAPYRKAQVLSCSGSRVDS